MELAEFNKGYWTALEDLTRFINELDSEGMTGNQVRSVLYSWALEARPYGRYPNKI